MSLRLLIVLLLTFMAMPAQSATVRSAHTEVELIAERTAIRPGEPMIVGLRMTMDEHWHVYWHNPGDAGMPTSIKWDLPEGFKAGPIQWPHPDYFEVAGLVSYAYEGTTLLMVQIDPPASPAQMPDGKVTIKARASWLECKEECIPGNANLSLELPVATAEPAIDSRWVDLFANARAKLPVSPVDGRISARIDGTRLVLSIASMAKPQGLRFFAADEGLIEYVAPQEATVSGGGTELLLKAGQTAAEKFTEVNGVLVVTTSEGTSAYQVNVPLQRAGVPPSSVTADGEQVAQPGSHDSLLMTMFWAFLGGILLNLMPCVFPVLSIKILSFVQQSGEDRRRVRMHGMMFGLGVLLSFWVLTALLLALRAGGEQLGWGFQLQHPGFVAVMALLMFAVGLNLAGVFEVGVGVMNLAGKASSQVESNGYGGSLFSGVLATAIATPCTAPLMGPAIGVALTMSPAQTVAVFTALGGGMAAPYMLLSCYPQWLKVLPRPGAWMITFKQIMAFPMFAATIWLVWVFGQQVGGANGIFFLLLGMLSLAIGAWAYGRWHTPSQRQPVRRVVAAVAMLLVVQGVALPYMATTWFGAAEKATGGIAWESYSEQLIEQHRSAGRPVFVDFTADWCLTCKVNEHTILSTRTVQDAFAANNVVMVKADWTSEDPVITQALARFGRSSVPLYVVYSPDPAAEPQVLPTVITPGMVVQAVQRAVGQSETISASRK